MVANRSATGPSPALYVRGSSKPHGPGSLAASREAFTRGPSLSLNSNRRVPGPSTSETFC